MHGLHLSSLSLFFFIIYTVSAGSRFDDEIKDCIDNSLTPIREALKAWNPGNGQVVALTCQTAFQHRVRATQVAEDHDENQAWSAPERTAFEYCVWAALMQTDLNAPIPKLIAYQNVVAYPRGSKPAFLRYFVWHGLDIGSRSEYGVNAGIYDGCGDVVRDFFSPLLD
jgi:hypothetical protein